MKPLHLVILAFILTSCAQKKPQIEHFKTAEFALVDTDVSANQFTYLQRNIDFPIYYIGPVRDTIRIGKQYWRGRTPLPTVPSVLAASRDYSPGKLSVTVDSSVKVNCAVEYFSDDEKTAADSAKNYYSHLVIIKNISDSAIWMGRTFSVFFMHLELKDKYGHWVKIGRKLSELSMCGTGEPTIFLWPGEIMLSKVRRYRGSFSTQARLAFGYGKNQVYSNTFDQSIDESLFKVPI